MFDKIDKFSFHNAIYNLVCPFTQCRFISLNKEERTIYYYNATVLIGDINEKITDSLVEIRLSPIEGNTPIYVNYIEEVATSIKNGLLPMCFLDESIKYIKEEHIRWFVLAPCENDLDLARYDEVKMKWDKRNMRYQEAYFINN